MAGVCYNSWGRSTWPFIYFGLLENYSFTKSQDGDHLQSYSFTKSLSNDWVKGPRALENFYQSLATEYVPLIFCVYKYLWYIYKYL